MADAVTTTSPTPTTGPGRYRRWWSKARTSFLWMVVVAFALRFGWIIVAHTYKFKTLDDNFSFGWEMGRIGRSLAQGQGFSNPFSETTGPTAWEPPLYPFLIAGVFKLFGVYTHASAVVLLSLNSLFSALTCIPIFLITKRCFSEKLAVWTPWLWAVMPSVMYWCTRWVWETSLATLLLALIFWLTLDLEERDGVKPWIYFGLLWGIAGLVNTSLLAFLPASGLWAWYRRWKRGKSSLGGVVLASLVFFVCIAPWLARNYRTFGFMLLRSNFGAELRIGNGPGADGTWREYLHPTQNVYQMRRFRQMGEIAYVAERKREAIAFIREDYARFIGLSLKRFIYYWGGVPRLSEIPALAPTKNSVFLASSVLAFWGLGRALLKKKPGAWLFFWLIFCYPAVYYAVFPHPRYRHPIEPELGILIVYVISEARKKAGMEPLVHERAMPSMARASKLGSGYHSRRWYSRHSKAVPPPIVPTTKATDLGEKKLHPLLAYMFRTLGIASLILGVGGTMSGTSFIFSAVCIYLGLLILVCDPWVEPSLNNRPVGRSLISVTFLVVMLLFSFGVVFYPAPLDTLAMSYEGRYKPGEVVYGIKWDDDMSDLRVDLNNPTERDYDHLDLILRLLDGRQIRNYSVVRTFPHVDLSPTGKEMHVKRVNKDGKLVDEENVPATGWPELRLACDRLPKKTTIALIFAVAEFDPSAKKAMTSPDGPTATDGKMDYWVLNSDDPQHDKLWKRSRATALRVFGDYTVIGRPHHVDYTYAVKQE